MIPAQQDIASASPIPDEIWVAKYDNKATIWNLGTLTDTPWPSNQRMHQYLNYNNDSSPAGESYGGTTFDCPNSCIDRDIDDAPVAGGAGMKNYSSWTINYIDYPSSPPDSQLWAANDANMGEPDGAGAYVPPLVTGGYCITPCYSASSDQGFWWSGGTFYDTNPYFGNMTQPRGVNDAGLITGAYLNGAATLGFSLDTTTGTASSVTLPSSWGAEQTVPNGINDAGEISSFYYTSTGPYGFIKDDPR